VLVLELPLFPFQNAYGRAQRKVVAKHGVAMLPKRYFARVLGAENGTLDGLHLSQAGHDAMARIIAETIQKE
jgi:lysophospholipase L1-like esterase